MPNTRLQSYIIGKRNPALANFLEMERLKNEIRVKADRELESFKEHLQAQMDRAVSDLEQKIELNKPVENAEPVIMPALFTEDDKETLIQEVQARIVVSNGKDGADGVTPIAGVDFPTPQQVQKAIVAQVKKIPVPEDGKTPVKGVDYFTKEDITEIVQAVPIEELPAPVIVDKINSLPLKPDKQIDASHIKNLPTAIRKAVRRSAVKQVGGGGTELRVYDLSASTDGVTKTFTVPEFVTAIMLTGTDFPLFYRKTVDFIATDTTLTIDAAVPAPSSGSSLFFWYNV